MRDSDIDRRTIIGGTVALLTAASSAGRAATPRALGVEARIAQGSLRGLVDRGVCVFRGVPYAGPVAGANRFKAAPPAPHWNGIFDATAFGTPSIQPPSPDMGPGKRMPAPGEDCLVLNIWTPRVDGARRPVMFYNHGGGFVSGSGSGLMQDGAALAREHDVVVVQSNHRLGLLGYLYLGHLLGPDYPGNQGLRDLAAALRWTHDNIAAFGGDPSNVMIFGESGGGVKTACLYAMPSAAPCFAKASIESGPAFRIVPHVADARETANLVLAELGISPAEARRILDVPAERLLAVQRKVGGSGGPILFGAPTADGRGGSGLGPFIDGDLLPASPFEPVAPAFSRGKPLIVEITTDETVFFNLGDKSTFAMDTAEMERRLQHQFGANTTPILAAYRKAFPAASPSRLYLRLTRDALMWSSAVLIAERKVSQGGAPVFMGELAYQSPVVVPGTDYPIGSPHASDIAMKFDNVPAPGPVTPGFSLFEDDHSPARKRAAVAMSTLWANFARTGTPSAPGQPSWPAYDLQRRATMFIDARCRLVDDPDAAVRRLWEAYRS